MGKGGQTYKNSVASQSSWHNNLQQDPTATTTYKHKHNICQYCTLISKFNFYVNNIDFKFFFLKTHTVWSINGKIKLIWHIKTRISEFICILKNDFEQFLSYNKQHFFKQNFNKWSFLMQVTVTILYTLEKVPLKDTVFEFTK